MSPKLSVVTGALDRPEGLQRLIDSVKAHTSVEWEMVISDASQRPYASNDERITVIHENPRLGCTRGYNQAFRACHGEFVIWANDDAEFLAGYDVAAINFMESHPQIGIGALHYKEGDSDFHVNGAWGVLYANFGILRRELGDKVGWFDESLMMYGNDNSLTLRVLLSDKGICDIPGAKVIHHSEKDSRREENQRYRSQDNKQLHDTYMPVRQYWLAAYRKHKLPGSAEPWPHGVEPAPRKRWPYR